MEQAPSPVPAAAPTAEPAPDWPPWFAFVGFFGALVCTALGAAIVLALLGADPDDETPTVVVVATLVQSVFFVGAALVLARSVAPPRPWHFGLRRAPLWRTVGWAAAGMVAFYVLTAIYAVTVDPSAEQEVTEDLGAGEGTFGLIVAGVMVMAFAPFVEELFFRGFFYRALRTRLPLLLAAAVDGIVFGLIHFDFEGADGLLLLPPLAILGAIFCLVYERTGTLWSVIGMHALNNAIAFSAQAEDYDGWQVAVVVGPLMLIACAVIPRLTRDGPAPLPPASRDDRPEAQLSLPLR